MTPERIIELADEAAQCIQTNDLSGTELDGYLQGFLKEIIEEALKPKEETDEEKITRLRAEFDAWQLKIYQMAKIGTVKFKDRGLGIIGVPPKYVNVFSVFSQTIFELMLGNPLPEFVVHEPAKKTPPKKSKKTLRR